MLADGKHSAQEERDAIDLLLSLRCEAILIYPKYLTVDELDEIIDTSETPIVVINRELSRNRSQCVFVDHQRWWSTNTHWLRLRLSSRLITTIGVSLVSIISSSSSTVRYFG